MKQTDKLCSSWLAGKYTLADGTEAEINTRLPYVSIGEYFVQGEEADTTIDEINDIYNDSELNLTVSQSIERWASYML